MLILAGVSLNAIVGDNGIITNAQNATIESKCAALEEYLQEFYVQNYDYFSNTSSKISSLNSFETSKKWIYKGKFGYILDKEGNVHYYLDCDNLNDEMKKIIGNWRTKTYNDYVEGNDVWGVTEDLKVYYAVKKSDGDFTYYGVNNPEFSQENGSNIVFAESSKISDIIGGNTIADARPVTNLSLGKDSQITNFNDFYNFINLDKLVLNNMTLDSLDGIEYCINLRAIFIQACKIGDYSSLAKLPKIRHIYLARY